MPLKRTKKKQQIVSFQQYIDSETGEVKKFKVINEEENSDYNFHKIWVKMLSQLLEELGGAKNKTIAHIFSNMNAQNIYIGTVLDIARKAEVGERSVKETLKIMKKADCIRMLMPGVYFVNPNLMAKGKSRRRQELLLEYKSIPNDKKGEE